MAPIIKGKIYPLDSLEVFKITYLVFSLKKYPVFIFHRRYPIWYFHLKKSHLPRCQKTFCHPPPLFKENMNCCHWDAALSWSSLHYYFSVQSGEEVVEREVVERDHCNLMSLALSMIYFSKINISYASIIY